MITALPLQVASLPLAAPHTALAHTSVVNTPVDPAHTNTAAAAHQTATAPQQTTPLNDVEAFYTVGYDSLGIGSQAAAMNTPNMPQFHDTEAYHGNQGYGGGSPSHGNFQENNSEPNHTNSSNIFADSINFLQKKGGPSDPLALFKLQAEVIEITLNWSLYGQMASKAASGIQSLFNNQV